MEIFPLLSSAFVSIVGGGFLGVWLTHRRLAPKSKAEARDITASAMDRDWRRFEREIGRLVKRLENAEAAAERAIEAQRACEQRESRLNGEVIKLRALLEQEGEARKLAAGIVAMERAEGRA